MEGIGVPPASDRPERRVAVGAWTLWAIGVLVPTCITASLAVGHGPPPDTPAGGIELVGYLLVLLVFGTVGAVLAARLPGNAIGWVLLGLGAWNGLTWAVGDLVENYGSGEAMQLAEWLGHWAWVPGIMVPATILPLLFPDGRPPTPRWRIVTWMAVLGTAGYTLSTATGPWLGGTPVYGPNPYHQPLLYGLSAVPAVLMLPALVGAVAAAVVRFRRAVGAERQQLKWFVWSVGVVVLAFVGVLPFGDADVEITSLVVWLAVLFVPLAIGIAVLRYRLYDIDRLISRTLSYTIVTAVLAGLYVTAVVLLGAVLRGLGGASDSDLVVAASTLLAVAAFGRVRRTAKQVVDRRFDRARYDAGRTVAGFGASLRDRILIEDVVHQLDHVTIASLHPSHVTVWLPTGAGTGSAGAASHGHRENSTSEPR
jgi:hypothetical protein